jgi:hypothetical protein
MLYNMFYAQGIMDIPGLFDAGAFAGFRTKKSLSADSRRTGFEKSIRLNAR